jgi:hypothetical protein
MIRNAFEWILLLPSSKLRHFKITSAESLALGIGFCS